jgi:L-ascorbate metabolism protein UlaG (beta-lactamase superfamily)
LSSVTFVGHATVELDLDQTKLLFDPLLGRGLGPLRRRAPQPDIDELRGVDAVLVSHMHLDHLDLRSLRRLGRPIIAPSAAAEFMRRRGLEDVTEIKRGDSVAVGTASIQAVHAEHLGTRYGRRGSDSAEALGYVVEGAGTRTYFAGDTELFEEMNELGPDIDLALIPIWGWGPNLGSGHLDPHTAAVALTLIRPRIAVPIHHATLSLPGSSRLWPWLLTRPAEEFVAAAAERAPDVDVRVLAPLETTTLPG